MQKSTAVDGETSDLYWVLRDEPHIWNGVVNIVQTQPPQRRIRFLKNLCMGILNRRLGELEFNMGLVDWQLLMDTIENTIEDNP